MIQQDIEKEEIEETQWEKDESYDDAEVVKLGVGESIEGLLIDKFSSAKWNAGIYKIKDKDDDKAKVIVGTTVIDKLMKPKEIGEENKIKRLEDSVNQKGQNFQNWETYHLHRSSSK